jgi:hypothetical protein
MENALSRFVRPAATAFILAALMAGSLVSGVSAAPRPITFEVFIGDYCVFGRAKNNSFLKVIVRDAQGRQKGREAVEADPQGFWESCTFLGTRPISPGDKISVEVFDTGQTRTFTVPLLTARVDRGTNVVSGKAPSGSTVELEAFDFRWDLWGESYDVVRNVTAGGGSYAHDFDSDNVDIKGGARVVVSWRNGSDTVRVGRFQLAPFVVLALGGSEVVGATRPNGPIKITLTRQSQVVARANGVGSYSDTSFFTEFADADGEAYTVRGGERLSAPALGAQSSWRIPQINTQTDVAADKVSGTCFANGRFVVLAEDPNGFAFGLDFGTAAGNGRFEVDLTSQMNLRKGHRVAVLCYSPGGDEVTAESIAR